MRCDSFTSIKSWIERFKANNYTLMSPFILINASWLWPKMAENWIYIKNKGWTDCFLFVLCLQIKHPHSPRYLSNVNCRVAMNRWRKSSIKNSIHQAVSKKEGGCVGEWIAVWKIVTWDGGCNILTQGNRMMDYFDCMFSWLKHIEPQIIIRDLNASIITLIIVC